MRHNPPLMASVYLETSLISACVTTRKDPASIYRRGTSRELWKTQAWRHSLFVSAEVLEELSQPTFPSSDAALDWIKDVSLLDCR
jgi:hypothetical protein